MLAEHHVDQRTGAIDGAIEVAPLPVDLDVGLVDVPAPAGLAASASPQTFSQRRRESAFPVANRLVAEYDAADQEHLRQIAQGKLAAQAPEHHEGDDVAGVLRPIQNAGTSLVELLAAGTAAEPTVTLSGALAPFRNGGRAAANAFRQPGLPRRGTILTPDATEQSRMARPLTEPILFTEPVRYRGATAYCDIAMA